MFKNVLEASRKAMFIKPQGLAVGTFLSWNVMGIVRYACLASPLLLLPRTINNGCLGILFNIRQSESRHDAPDHMSQVR